jgi:hypothetical protein
MYPRKAEAKGIAARTQGYAARLGFVATRATIQTSANKPMATVNILES